MPAADRAWRRGVMWAVIFALAAIVLPVRSLQIALRLDSLRGVPAWPDWLLALGLAGALAGIAGLFARGAALRRERWLWRLARLAAPPPAAYLHGERADLEIEPPYTFDAEWRPLWLLMPLTLVFVAGMAFVLACIFCAVYWGLTIAVPLVNPDVVYRPLLRMRFFYLYLVMPILPLGVVWFTALSMIGYPSAPKLIVDEHSITRISSLGWRRTIRWEDARLLECSFGNDKRPDLASYRNWALSTQTTVITWDNDLVEISQRRALARLIYERTGLVPYELKQRFWRRSPLVVLAVRELPPEDDLPNHNG